MTLRSRLSLWLQNEWIVSFFLLGVLILTKGYKFGWDDQHLEIPLLKGLIDPTLYVGDYYVEALKSNFASYFYVLLAKIISTDQIPAAYFILYVISKFFLIFWAYKLWDFISGEKSIAFICTMAFLFFGRVPEFHYRTFSHQEFTLAFVMAGIYFFYSERFVIASAIFGFAGNFHFIYSLFPMTYLALYLLSHHRRYRFTAFFKSCAIFLIFASPILILLIKNNLPHYKEPLTNLPVSWITLYKLGCPQNFLFFGITFKYMLTNFKVWFSVAESYILLIVLYAFNAFFNRTFQEDKKIHIITITATALLVVSYIFTYVKPSPFVLDLNLFRNTQFLFFFFIGYTVIFFVQIFRKFKPLLAYAAAITFNFFVLNDTIAIAMLIFLSCVLFLDSRKQITPKFLKTISYVIALPLMALCLGVVGWFLFRPDLFIKIICAAGLLLATLTFALLKFPKFSSYGQPIRRLFVILPLLALVIYYGSYHYHRNILETSGPGFWKLQRDWENLQIFAKTHTPKDALFLIPNDMEMGGFRIHSERKVICCYRDCGIVGFSFPAAVEWLKRLSDIEPFKVIIIPQTDLTPALSNAIKKYKANYIVFMRYYAPPLPVAGGLVEVFKNDSFVLFKVPSFAQ